jgi:hypothetical protein
MADARLLHIEHSGTEIELLRAIGTVDGVQLDYAAGRNGPGAGSLSYTPGAGLAWRPPTATQYGDVVDVSAGGTFDLDGPADNADETLTVTVTAASLPASMVTTPVYLQDVYNNKIAYDNRKYDAGSDGVDTWQLTLRNTSGSSALTTVKCWIDSDRTTGAYQLELSTDGSTWFQPDSEAHANVINLGTIATSGTTTLHVRRTITAGNRDVHILSTLYCAFDVGGVRHYHDWRGRWHVPTDPAYWVYIESTPPDDNVHTPTAEPGGLPWTSSALGASGTFYVSVAYFNGYESSGFLTVGDNGETYRKLILIGSAEQPIPPNGVIEASIQPDAGGKMRVTASYDQAGANRATEFALAWSTGGTPPPTSTPDRTASIPAAGLAVLDEIVPDTGEADGTLINVRIQTRRSGVYSDSVIVSDYADNSTPSPPRQVTVWRGSPTEAL